MAKHWHGEQIYNSNAERDRDARRIEDFVQSKMDIVPHPDADYTTDPSGVEYRNNIVYGDDSGPGFLWSLKIPGDEATLVECAALGDGIQQLSLTGSQSYDDIPD